MAPLACSGDTKVAAETRPDAPHVNT